MAPGVPRRVTWRRLPQWPYPEQVERADRFQTSWAGTLDLLELEIGRVGGEDISIGVVVTPDLQRLDGSLRMSHSGPVGTLHPGAEVSFTHPVRGRLSFHTAAYPSVHGNLHAIARTLEALRAVDRHGTAETAEQYEGWAQLPSGKVEFRPDPEEGQRLALEHGGLKAAIKALHPDRNEGVTSEAYQHVMAFKEAIGA